MTNEKPASPTQGELAVKALDARFHDRAKEKLRLWFFRDMSDEQRLKLFSLFGLPTDEIGESHGHQSIALKHVLSALDRTTLSPTEEGMVLVPKSALDWLFGEGPDEDGIWFGDAERVAGSGAFWWRTVFRRLISGRLALTSGREE